jgi:hypothetical protein
MDGPLVREKTLAGAASLLTVCAVLWPVVENWRKKPKDDFPLSHYPMFSAKRPKSASFTYLVGLGASGERHVLPHTHAGAGGLNQIRKHIRKAVVGGKADELARLVAARIILDEQERFSGVVTVQVVTGKYRLEDYFAGKQDPVSEVVHASCPVERGHRAPLRIVENLA